jgi:hypothetical protein
MVRLIISLILIGLISSCSAEWHMRKAIQKDPDIIDTRIVYKFDTLWTNSMRLRDSVSIDFKDSVVITNDTITVKLTRIANNKLRVAAEVKPYRIYRKITQYRTIIRSDRDRFNSLFWQIVFALVIVIGASKFIDKTIK